MSSSYNKGFRSVYKLNAHMVFVTKYRKKVIDQEILERLHMIFKETLDKWGCQLNDFNGESDHCHLLIEFKPDVQLSKLIANLKTVSSRLIRKEYPEPSNKYFDGKPHFWTGAYFVASCGGVTVEQLKAYVEKQKSPDK
ncbi:MAG: IS200/IS605 family transposase [Xenococcaceae cyanobacterium MO_167.B27]|nr:IS200/IS605 family transposase [Xenococcaceae cyanobacterium MO_167.B27]